MTKEDREGAPQPARGFGGAAPRGAAAPGDAGAGRDRAFYRKRPGKGTRRGAARAARRPPATAACRRLAPGERREIGSCRGVRRQPGARARTRAGAAPLREQFDAEAIG